jgi:hypothetical protein
MLAKISDAGAKANCYLSCFNDLLGALYFLKAQSMYNSYTAKLNIMYVGYIETLVNSQPQSPLPKS